MAAAPAARRRTRTTQEVVAENRGPGLATTALRTLLGLAVVLALGAVIFFGAAAIEGDEPSPLAPWSAPAAPSVAPEPLADQ